MTEKPMTENTSHTHSAEERLSVLEARVETLAQAVRALAEGLEANPAAAPEAAERVTRGARLAHELLLAQGM
ncbi:hypothetical protein I3F58_14855 [Streptomyces sp. MUM 203J]|uniref:hypothetical protein n=1 Tax=Streptomyces sp. MUM 203J TaxID=2791990 RepID=UPI001F03D060|nr:hypothetical protein [Streptomyces sp. MUM 203J]MCH0540826.1 hypothetical protein [Streptomyces sp. MUM 203J]